MKFVRGDTSEGWEAAVLYHVGTYMFEEARRDPQAPPPIRPVCPSAWLWHMTSYGVKNPVPAAPSSKKRVEESSTQY